MFPRKGLDKFRWLCGAQAWEGPEKECKQRYHVQFVLYDVVLKPLTHTGLVPLLGALGKAFIASQSCESCHFKLKAGSGMFKWAGP